MVSAIVWSKNVDIKYVNELLYINPEKAEQGGSLESVLTVLYEHKDNTPNWDLNFVQRGEVLSPRILLPYDISDSAISLENSRHNEILSRADKKRFHDLEMRSDSVQSPSLKGVKHNTTYYFDAVNSKSPKEYYDKRGIKKYKQDLRNNLPFSKIKVEGSCTSKTKRTNILRLAYSINGNIAKVRKTDNCPFPKSIRYNIMTPARVFNHLADEEIRKRIFNVYEKDNVLAEKVFRLFHSDLDKIREHCSFLLPDEKERIKNSYEFNLVMVLNNAEKFDYTMGYEGGVRPKTISSLDSRPLIFVEPETQGESAGFPLIFEPLQGKECDIQKDFRKLKKKDSKLQKEFGTLQSENSDLQKEFRRLREELLENKVISA